MCLHAIRVPEQLLEAESSSSSVIRSFRAGRCAERGDSPTASAMEELALNHTINRHLCPGRVAVASSMAIGRGWKKASLAGDTRWSRAKGAVCAERKARPPTRA
jgi:hypothetical protein